MYVSNSIHGQVITLRIFYGYIMDIMDIFPSYYLMTALYLQDERCRLMRRNIMRYANLSYVMKLRMISTRVKKRFPTLDHLVEAGLMLPNEKISDDLKSWPRHQEYLLPLAWAGSIVTLARQEGRIPDDIWSKILEDELDKFRTQCSMLSGYDWFINPLVYTKVVTFTVCCFYAAALMGRQLIGAQTELHIPIHAFLQFLFYMCSFKVVASKFNPFGDDDDDDVTIYINRNLRVSYLMVDGMNYEHPELIRDRYVGAPPYWDNVLPDELPPAA